MHTHKSQAESSRIGIDARMISHEKATLLNSKLSSVESKLVLPSQNLVDLIWKAKPVKPDAAIYIQSVELAGVFDLSCLFAFSQLFSGRDANHKLSKLREWIQQQPSSAPSYVKAQDSGRQYAQVATLVTSLACIGMIC
jgi:Xaa-Pro aminopeptidase